MSRFLLAAALAFGLGIASGSQAAPASSNQNAPAAEFTVEGHVTKPLHLTVADLKAQPATTVEVSYIAQGKTQTGSFTGVPLLVLLTQAGVIDGQEKGAHFRHSIDIVGSDGYAVSVAMGEIDAEGEGKTILIAYARDGQPLSPPGSLRLVVPGDHHGARAVRDVAKIEVK
jgi:DMSO/TMAO reductase YedYZ molybdopterin-dependent catalytic subunit